MHYTKTEYFLMNFYVADKNRTTFEHADDVPNLLQQMVPMWSMLIVFEYIIAYLMTGKTHRLSDGITSMITGITMDITKLFIGGIELAGYHWLYQYRFIDLDWQSPWTWWAAAIGVDLGYYWLHRSAHEISLFWCGHQVHHSSEDYNFTTAMRQSAFQHIFTLGIYQPLALCGISLPALLVHLQLNLLIQFWIHTELVSNLGPLEWIFNTASHHRVHHGANKYCLDKNYAGFLIIWDRMFGTFESERSEEKITFGLVSQPQTFNPFHLQLFYFKNLYNKAMSMKTWSDFCKALFYGPGWQPGTPRLGDLSTMPDGHPVREKWDPKISTWVQWYLLGHFIVIAYLHNEILSKYFDTLTWYSALCFIAFIFYSFFVIGAIFDDYWVGTILEAIRCIVTVAFILPDDITGSPMFDSVIRGYFALSAIVWSLQSVVIINNKIIGTDDSQNKKLK